MFVIVMGVSGSGKNTVGELLAARMNWPFYDADNFHPVENVAKMAAGVPLDDQDRAGWLHALAALIRRGLAAGEHGVIACSALKERYRDVLRVDRQQVEFVYLKGSYEVIWERMQRRQNHYMKPAMLESQFAALEEPQEVLTCDIVRSPEEIVDSIMDRLLLKNKTLGLVGLGVMGRSLAANLARHGYRVVGYDLAPHLPAGSPVQLAATLAELAASLPSPRIVLLMVPAGEPVDAALQALVPHLEIGDIVIDGGNSHFTDSERRVQSLAARGLHFVAMGVSGGESGALWGPSLMPSGAAPAKPYVLPIARAIAATAPDGEPCATWIGPGGAGHFVKMVHNGIEYGDMQLIAEVYDLLHRGAGLSNPEIAAIFASWNEQELRSYLVEITANILAHTDEETGESLVDLILDEAAQKGTGKWTSQTSLDVGAAVPTIHSAVQSRLLSSLKGERRAAAHLYGAPHLPAGKVGDVGDVASLVAAARDALYASKVTAYAQGLSLLRAAAQEYGWNLDLAAIVRVWRAGCIIRAGLLDDIAAAFSRDPDLPNLLLDPHFARAIRAREANWRCVVQTAVKLRIPLLAIGASLSYFDSYRSERLPANLIQAQRDYFGAHTYRRTDRAGVFHTDWEAPAHKTAAASPAPALARA